MKNLLMPGAEPFYFPGGPVGCLLVHGFTGTPFEMRWLGEYLAAQGFTVLAVRLAGHGTSPEDMVRTTWRDWLASVEDGLALLAGCTSRFALGLSLGGVLSLLSASRHTLNGVVAMSTPYTMPSDWRVPYIRPLSRLVPRLEKGDPGWKNPAAALDHVEYPFTPTRSTAELRDALAELRAVLPSIRTPVFLAHSRIDTSVPAESMTYLAGHIGSQHVQTLWLEASNHVIIREPEREQLFAAIADFIHQFKNHNP